MRVFYVTAIAAGLSDPAESAVTAALNRDLGQPLVSAFVTYGVALSTLKVASLVDGLSTKDLGGKFGRIPWRAFTGDVCDLAFVLAFASGSARGARRDLPLRHPYGPACGRAPTR